MANYSVSFDPDWGVPTVKAVTFTELWRGLGFAQAYQNSNLVMTTILRACGRSAEFLGQHSGAGPNELTKQPTGVDYLQSDLFVRMLQLPTVARAQIGDQTAETLANVEAYAAGINDCLEQHLERFDSRLLAFGPVTAEHVFCSSVQLMFGFQLGIRMPVIHEWMGGKALVDPSWCDLASAGSNGWVVGPSKSVDGNPMLVCNPHTQWDVDLNTFIEARLELTDGSGFVFQGAGIVGWPAMLMGCNAHLGFGSTVNQQNGITFYEVSISEGAIDVEGEGHRVEFSQEAVLCRQSDGSLKEHSLKAIWSPTHQGNVIASRGDRQLLVSFGGRNAGQVLEQYFAMVRSESIDEYQAALEMHQIPIQNLMYAGRDSANGAPHIQFSYHSHTPDRGKGTYADWWHVLDGHQGENIASGLVAFNKLFQDIDTANGWYQNCNDSPYSCTLPSPFDPSDYPAWLAPVSTLKRAQGCARHLTETAKFDFDSLVQMKFSTRVELAKQLVPQLSEAINERSNSLLKECKSVLDTWDQHTEPESRGAFLFLQFILNVGIQDGVGNPIFADSWRDDLARDQELWPQSLDTPGELADIDAALKALETAAKIVKDRFGALDIAWGDAVAVTHGDVTIPGVGGPGDPLGILAAVPLEPGLRPFISGGDLVAARIENDGGETFVMVAEFTPEGVRGGTLTSYGASSNLRSPHYGDQLTLVGKRELRPFTISK